MMSNAEEIETPYLTEEINLKKVTPFRVIWEMFKITAWQNFTHHPTCSVYKNHYFKIGPVKLCVGCTSFYSMLAAALIAFFSANTFFRTYPIILPIVYLVGIAGMVSHIIIHPKNKWVKSLFRGLLGLGIGSYIAIIVLGPVWWTRLILGLFLPIELALFFIIRGSRANLELCETCVLHTADPPCDPMKNTEIRTNKLNELIDKQIEGIQQYWEHQKELEEQEKLAKKERETESESSNEKTLDDKD